jgi:hypothetical protein
MTKQYELDGMPGMTELEKIATDYVKCKEAIKAQKERMEMITPQLISAFKGSGEGSIKVRGHLVSFAEVEKVSSKAM